LRKPHRTAGADGVYGLSGGQGSILGGSSLTLLLVSCQPTESTVIMRTYIPYRDSGTLMPLLGVLAMDEVSAAWAAAVQFGIFEADLRAGELRKRGVRVKLQEQPFLVLQTLLEHPGQVVTRDQLQQKIWPADTFVDFDHGLNNAIKKLREALSDSAESPRFIETIPRHGYRFIAHVSAAMAKSSRAPLQAPQDSIAVLPFVNIGGDSENESFSDGVTEEIINVLTQIKQLRVAARTSSFSFKGKHVDLRIIGEKLNVRTVLEGSVRRANNRLRITAQLVNAEDGYHLWSERYDRELKDIFEIQEEIARSIAERLKITVDGSEQLLLKAGTEDLAAYELYVKGRALAIQRGHGLLRSIQCFKQAVDLDPNYGLARAALADAYNLCGFYGLMSPETCMPQAKEAAQRAAALTPSLAESHAALAMSHLLYDWDRSRAEAEFLLAMELNPRHVQARVWHAVFSLQWAAGRHEEAIAQAKQAVEWDPLSAWARAMLAIAYISAGKMREAEETAKAALRFGPDSFLARWSLQSALNSQARYEEAKTVGEQTLILCGRYPWVVASLALTYDELGNHDSAKALYMELYWRAKREYVSPAVLGWAAFAAAEKDDAIRYACESHTIGDPLLIIAKHWPDYARLRQEARFQEILVSRGLT